MAEPANKKAKKPAKTEKPVQYQPQDELPSEKLKKKHQKNKKVEYTVCIPSTVISSSNAKSLLQVTQVAYELAKSLTIYNVAEVVILNIPEFHEEDVEVQGKKKIKFNDISSNAKSSVKLSNECIVLATLLQYFITPPYLVKSFFMEDLRKHLKHVKGYPTITTLPFMTTNYLDQNENAPLYREGLSVAEKSDTKHVPGTKVKSNKLTMTKYVNVGLDRPLELANEKIPTNVRVTVNVKERKIVSPHEAYYSDTLGPKSSVGYFVRVAKSFSSIFTESAFQQGYSNSVLVESGCYFNNKSSPTFDTSSIPELDKVELPKQKNNIIIFVGPRKDILASFKNDEAVKDADLKDFFNNQQSIPILTRIEDAVLISLSKIEAMK